MNNNITKTMKTVNTIITAFLIGLISSCGAGSVFQDNNVDSLKHERDSLKELSKNVESRIIELEALIAELDTTVKKRINLVAVYNAVPEYFVHYTDVHGVVQSKKNVALTPEIGGLVKRIMVTEGDMVNKGDLLVMLENEVIQKSIDEVETAYELAKTLFQRQDNLWKQNIGSEIQYLEAKNRKESLELKLKTLKAQHEMTQLRAPFSGVVDEIFSKLGEMASPGIPVLRLINMEQVQIIAEVPEFYMKNIKSGTEALVSFPSIGEERKVKITRSGEFINPLNRTFKIQIELDNKDKNLKPNMLCIVKIKDLERDSVLVVPSMAIQQDARGNEFVFVAKNKLDSPMTAMKSFISSGKSFEGRTIIENGLDPNSLVIIEGVRGLKEGDIIEVN
jgi:membrane fusion protein, multidrug efflux system